MATFGIGLLNYALDLGQLLVPITVVDKGYERLCKVQGKAQAGFILILLRRPEEALRSQVAKAQTDTP